MTLRKQFSIAALILFLVASCFFVCPVEKKGRYQFHSSQLRVIETIDENIERTDYVNSDGQNTIAADKGYATIIVTKISEDRKQEQYYDDQGEPISRYNGYYGIFQDYDEKGNIIRITYLNREGEPMIMANGYAIEEREYNDKRQEISVSYYDTEKKPILTSLYGHGKINEYNENGKIRRITYIDISGNPIMTGQGYASVMREYYASNGRDNGQVESEFYFDEIGDPVVLSLGQSGVHKEYDEYGRQTILTYLDASGNSIITKKGYTTVVRSFQANNSVVSEQYLDIDGQPFSLSEGQYGVEIINGQMVYLDENGNEQFNIKNLLYNHPRLIIISAMIIVLLSTVFSKKWNLFFVAGYIIAIAYMTLMFRENNGATLKLEPFWSYREIVTNSEVSADVLKNIWLFIPLGAILYRIYPNARIFLIPILLSILIEAIQYFSGIGFCELDDVISNGLGGTIGYGMGHLAQMIRKQFYCKGDNLS